MPDNNDISSGDVALASGRSCNFVLVASRRASWDEIVVAFVFFAAALVRLLIGIMLVTGIGHFTEEDASPPTFLFALGIRSELAVGVYCLGLGATQGLAGYGLLRVRQFGWWIALVLLACGIIVNLLCFNRAPISAVFTVLIGLILAGWLAFRARTYGVRQDKAIDRNSV